MTVTCGDCRDVMAAMDDASVDAIVTDPPYGLAFLGHAWDRRVPDGSYGRGPWAYRPPARVSQVAGRGRRGCAGGTGAGAG